MTTDDVLLGLGLVIVLAVGARLISTRLGLPAIVVLLPVGFLAGTATDVVHPDMLLGQLYQPFVSLAVGMILFEAGLRLSFAELGAGLRRLVASMVIVGIVVTWVAVAVATALLFDGLGGGIPVLIGAILVVSGPTVVLPLLAFVRPAGSVRSLLLWEGVLVDPAGAILGVLVFHAVLSGGSGDGSWRPGELLASVGVGIAVGVVAAGVMWLLLEQIQRTEPRQAVPAVFMVVIAAVVGADLLREDTGFVAATVMGVALANQRRIDVTLMLEFHATLVQLLIGSLFVLIAASVTASEIEAVLWPTLALVLLMVVVIRPLAVALATRGSRLSVRERAFVAWMAPRGIVAGATASAFGLELQQAGVSGAEKILPITFVVIFTTVVLYGLTAGPVARWLGVAGRGGTVVLVVGGNHVARKLAEALKRNGVEVRLWAGGAEDQLAARAVGLDPHRGSLMVDAVSREAELEEITDALVLTRYDDFNALAAAELRIELGHAKVYRVAPDPAAGDLVAPPNEAGIVAGVDLTYEELDRRLANGGRLVDAKVNGSGAPEDGRGRVPLFTVTATGRLRVATEGAPAGGDPGDTVITLEEPAAV